MATELQEERDKIAFDKIDNDTLLVMLDRSCYTRHREAIEFMKSHPDLVNTHKYYEMTREEIMEHQMKKFNTAWKLGKEKWFLKHDPSLCTWSSVHLG